MENPEPSAVKFASVAASIRATAGRAVSTSNKKMPGSTFATSPFHCATGAKLRTVEGSVCNKCYAIRLCATRPSVKQGYETSEFVLRRIASLERSDAKRVQFVHGMAHQITTACEKEGEHYHRWFDAGDLYSIETLSLIIDIVLLTPDIAHWLPTRELGIVRQFAKLSGATLANISTVLPANLVVRISSTMIGDAPRSGCEHTSTVHRKNSTISGHGCPAKYQSGSCGDCRACWDPGVSNSSYEYH